MRVKYSICRISFTGEITEVGVSFESSELAEEAIQAYLTEEPQRKYFIVKTYVGSSK